MNTKHEGTKHMQSPIEALKILRAQGLSQQKIAELLHLSQPTVCRIERGEVIPNYIVADALRKAAAAALKSATNSLKSSE